MRYEKPNLVELAAGARAATAEGFRTCKSGASAGLSESCNVGNSAGWACVAGPSVSTAHPSCMNGGAANVDGDCISGTVVSFYCEAGTLGGNDSYGCRVGPSVV